MRQLPELCASCGRQIATLETCVLPDGTHKRGVEPATGRASSLTMVPTGKNALQAPLPPLVERVQSIPAGWDVIRPLPSGMIETLPLAAAKAVCTVIVEDLVYLLQSR